MKRLIRLLSLLGATSLFAQAPPPPFVTGLNKPTKLIFTSQRNLIVAETDVAPNSGRVSLIDRTSGTRRTLIDGLPSAVYTGTEPASPSGVSGLALRGRTLLITIGNGNATVPGPVPASEKPNPAGPASPLLSSVLSLEPSVPLDGIKGGFSLNPSQHAVLKSGSAVTLTNGEGEQLVVRVVTDFVDSVASPRPDYPENVKNANPFGLAVQGHLAFVVESSQNLIRRVDLTNGSSSTLTAFPPFANPTTMGPPMIEAVPDSVRVRGNELLVTTLTGFPFPAGSAGVYRVDISSGTIVPLVSGFNSAIDVEPLGPSLTSPLLVLEFSTNMVTGALGRLRMVTPGSEPVVVAQNLVTPTSFVVDRATGEAFITLMGPGAIARVPVQQFVSSAPPAAVVAGVGSTSGAFGSRWATHSLLHNPNAFPISGRMVFHPAGWSAAAGDPSLAYTLAPYETRGYPDLIGTIGGSGLGSLDVVAAVGPAPVMTVRIADESGQAQAATAMPVLDPGSSAITAGFSGTVITPPDIATQRFNIGIRTLAEGATIRIVQRGPAGELLSDSTRAFPPDYFTQVSAADLMGGPVGGRNSIAFEVQNGGAVVYAAAVRNDGKSMIVQSPRPF